MGQTMIEQYPVATQATDTNQPVVAQLAPSHLGLFGQRMVTPAGQHERLVDQWREVDLGVLAAKHVDTEIRLTTQHRFQALVGTEIENADADLRVLTVELADHRGQEIESCGRNTSQRHLTRLTLGQLANAQNRTFEIVQQATGLGQEIPAYRGQADAPRGSIE